MATSTSTANETDYIDAVMPGSLSQIRTSDYRGWMARLDSARGGSGDDEQVVFFALAEMARAIDFPDAPPMGRDFPSWVRRNRDWGNIPPNDFVHAAVNDWIAALSEFAGLLPADLAQVALDALAIDRDFPLCPYPPARAA